jgi:hypothetical protein
MNAAIQLSLADLPVAVGRILDAVERERGSLVDVLVDDYWHLWTAAAFDLADPRPALTVGRVSDDRHSLRDFVTGTDQQPLWHVLQHAIGVLRALQHTVPDVWVAEGKASVA